jgi:hypothetical protein
MGLLAWLRRRRRASPDPAEAFAAPPHQGEPAGDEEVAMRLFGGLAAAMIARRRHLAGPRSRRLQGPVDRPDDATARDRLVDRLCGPAGVTQPQLRDLRRIYGEAGRIAARVWSADRDRVVAQIAEHAAAERDRVSDPLLVSGLEQLTDHEVIHAELDLAERVYRRLSDEPR